MADPTHVADLLAEVFRRGGMKKALRRAQAVLLWPQVAGRQLARFTRARNLRDGVLFVDVPDSETAMHLTLQRQRFLDVFHGRFGAREVRDIRFQTGRLTDLEEPEPQPAPPSPVDPHELSRLTRELGHLDLPEGLARPTLQAARSMLAYRSRRRSEGWTTCPACETLTPEPGLCSTCSRYSEEPKVRAAVGRLAVDPGEPTPLLSEEERAVAALLAQESLEGTLRELLPQVIAEPGLRPQLESAARCLLALRLDKSPDEVDDDDLATLPPRIARVLGHWS